MPPRDRHGGDAAASKTSRKGRGTRTIYVADLGTTYGTIGVLTMPASAPNQTITPASIGYIDGYPEDCYSGIKASDIVPTSLYFGGDGVKWGWDVSQHLKDEDNPIHQQPDRCITQFKLLPDETQATEDIRKDLGRKVRFLKKEGIIKHEDDLFFNYFHKWLTFARYRAHETELDPGAAQPEFVICAPSAYSVTSYQRLYKAFERAIRIVWPQHDDKHPPRIFSIAEPAAAASYSLARSDNSLQVSTVQQYIITYAKLDRLETASLWSMVVAAPSNSSRTRK
jgi:hypothetical protein